MQTSFRWRLKQKLPSIWMKSFATTVIVLTLPQVTSILAKKRNRPSLPKTNLLKPERPPWSETNLHRPRKTLVTLMLAVGPTLCKGCLEADMAGGYYVSAIH